MLFSCRWALALWKVISRRRVTLSLGILLFILTTFVYCHSFLATFDLQLVCPARTELRTLYLRIWLCCYSPNIWALYYGEWGQMLQHKSCQGLLVVYFTAHQDQILYRYGNTIQGYGSVFSITNFLVGFSGHIVGSVTRLYWLDGSGVLFKRAHIFFGIMRRLDKKLLSIKKGGTLMRFLKTHVVVYLCIVNQQHAPVNFVKQLVEMMESFH